MKFQQVTSPVTAKGVEDTAFYRYNRLVCLNEVGGDPRRFSVSTAALHQANLERAKLWPSSMLATSTHDTKRSEDVRARIAVISELPDLWKLHLSRWGKLNRSKRRQVEGAAAPSREDEYLIYQTLAGMWTTSEDNASLIERLQAYMVKATREAKRSTSWLAPNAEYEKAVCEFVAQLLENPERNAFLRDFSAFVEPIVFFGGLNSLVQVALKLTVPGVPDIYQGTERLSLTLVDPDNRRPVDYEAAAQRLDELPSSADALGSLDLDSAKLLVTSRLLQVRRDDPDLFEKGAYHPLQVEGERSDHLAAYARVYEERCCIVVLPRWCARLKQGAPELPLGEQCWLDTEIVVPFAFSLRDVFTNKAFGHEGDSENRRLRVAEVLQAFPLAVLLGS